MFYLACFAARIVQLFDFPRCVGDGRFLPSLHTFLIFARAGKKKFLPARAENIDCRLDYMEVTLCQTW